MEDQFNPRLTSLMERQHRAPSATSDTPPPPPPPPMDTTSPNVRPPSRRPQPQPQQTPHQELVPSDIERPHTSNPVYQVLSTTPRRQSLVPEVMCAPLSSEILWGDGSIPEKTEQIARPHTSNPHYDRDVLSSMTPRKAPSMLFASAPANASTTLTPAPTVEILWADGSLPEPQDQIARPHTSNPFYNELITSQESMIEEGFGGASEGVPTTGEVLWSENSLHVGPTSVARPKSANPRYDEKILRESGETLPSLRASFDVDGVTTTAVTPTSASGLPLPPPPPHPRSPVILWASEGRYVDPVLLDRPKTSKSKLNSPTLPPNMHHLHLLENNTTSNNNNNSTTPTYTVTNRFQQLPPQQPSPPSSVPEDLDEILWAQSSTHVNAIARPHTSNPTLTTFFATQSASVPDSVTNNRDTPDTIIPSGEIIFSHDDNVYDLREIVEVQQQRIQKLEMQVAELLRIISISNRQQHVVAQQVVVADPECVALDFVTSPPGARGHSVTTQPPPPATAADSPQMMTQTPSPAPPQPQQQHHHPHTPSRPSSAASFYNTNTTLTSPPVSASKDFGVEDKFDQLVAMSGGGNGSCVLPKPFVAKWLRQEVIKMSSAYDQDDAALNRKVQQMLAKYKSAGIDVLTKDEFALVYLHLVSM